RSTRWRCARGPRSPRGAVPASGAADPRAGRRLPAEAARDGCAGTPRARACPYPQSAPRAATDPGTACAWIPAPRRRDPAVMTNDTSITPIGLLTGKVMFITGASRGIGAAAAQLFAQEGAAVVIAARSTDALDQVVAKVRADGGVA